MALLLLKGVSTDEIRGSVCMNIYKQV
jgi:hypothetical protein